MVRFITVYLCDYFYLFIIFYLNQKEQVSLETSKKYRSFLRIITSASLTVFLLGLDWEQIEQQAEFSESQP
jgi:hypothetical protein